MMLDRAVDTTIDDMPMDFVIRKYLIQNKAEVTGMCLTEYDEKETMQMFKEEAIKEERTHAIKTLKKNLKYSAEQAMDVLDIPQSEYSEYTSML